MPDYDSALKAIREGEHNVYLFDYRIGSRSGFPIAPCSWKIWNARSGRRNDSMAVLFLDLDGFKLVNDSLGHEAGDKLLAAVAGRSSKSCVRVGDLVARLGGDEFALLLEDITNVTQAVGGAERIIREVRNPSISADVRTR